MRARQKSLLVSAIVAAALLAGCQEDRSPAAPDLDEPRLSHKPGHGGGGGGKPGGGSPVDPVDLVGGMITTAEPGVIWKENKHELGVESGTDCADAPRCFDVELSLASLAGNPTVADLGACVIDPPDMDAVTLGRLVAHLDDPLQGRPFSALANTRTSSGNINAGFWTESDGFTYAVSISTNPRLPDIEITVTEGPANTFTFEDGSVRIRTSTPDPGAVDAYLVCPNTGSVTMTLDR